MIVQTVLCQPEGYYISCQRWNDPNTAFRQRRHEWRFIGASGWYVTEANKRLFEQVNAAIPDLASFHPMEYDEVSITLEE